MSSKKHFFRKRTRLKASNVISLWSFEDNYLDSIGNNNASSPSPSFTNGLIGRMAFVGTASHRVIVPNDISLSFNDGVNDVEGSITTIFETPVVGVSGQNQFITSKRGLGGNPAIGNEYDIVITASGELWFRLFNNGGTDRIQVTESNPSLTAFQFHHLTCTYDGSGLSSGMKMYLDGLPIGTSAMVGAYTGNTNFSNDMILGNNSWNPINQDSLKGHLDEYKKWSIELTPEEALELATLELAGIRVI